MTPRLIVRRVGGIGTASIDLSRAPSPTVMADGIAGVCRRGTQYGVEGAPGMDLPAGHIPKERSSVPDGVERETAAAAADGRPPYRVPTMAEIRALPWNGLNVASTFAGGGGSSTGYRMAGYRVLYASEFVEAARETYRANCAHYTFVDDRDVRQVTAADLLARIGMEAGQLDVLDGSPPCASFSTSGKREKGWGTVKAYSDVQQRSDDLFFEFARLVDGVRPRVFVAENVSGLVKGTAKGYFLEILARLKGCGYRVQARLLDAQWLGVPQARQRLIFVGVRDDLGMDPVHPSPLPYRYSVRDALPWISRVGGLRSTGFGAGRMIDGTEPCPTIMAGGGGGMNTSQFGVEAALLKRNGRAGVPDGVERLSLDEPLPTVVAGTHGSGPHEFYLDAPPVEPEADISRFAIGREWDKLRPGQMKDRRYINLYRPHPDKPCPTITAGGGPSGAAGVTHPLERRKFSIAELRRICGFPDDFVLQGTYAQQWERCGRAVPPVMMSHVAAAVRDGILKRVKP